MNIPRISNNRILHKQFKSLCRELETQKTGKKHNWGKINEVRLKINEVYTFKSIPLKEINLSFTIIQICRDCGMKRRTNYSITENTIHQSSLDITGFPRKTSLCYNSPQTPEHVDEGSQVDQNKLLKEKREDQKYNWVKEQTQRNLTIIKNISVFRGPKYKKRRNYAIYRLYRYCDVPVNTIVEVTGLWSGTVKNIIGQVFKSHCLRSSQCVFQTVFD